MNAEAILGAGYQQELDEVESAANGVYAVGKDGVRAIYSPRDRKADFIVYQDRIDCYVRSALGYPAVYPLREPAFCPPAKAVLMDLDGTSVHSEAFWVWIIQQTVCKILNNPRFSLEDADLPFVSGHSVSEHLQYCLDKYCPGYSLENARQFYFSITHEEMEKIMKGEGRADAFTPAPHLKEFLLTLKKHNIRIGLVTSGLTEKAMPEIVSAFRVLGMGDPLDFYDAVISAGTAIRPGQVGTMGELEPKPHPWLYAETARVGLGIGYDSAGVVALEDSSAGVLSVRLAGFPCIGIEGGNIRQSGVTCLCSSMHSELMDVLPLILKEA